MSPDKTTSLTINGKTITLEEVARFAPIVFLQESDAYSPCTIDFILERAKLHADGSVSAKPTQAALAAVADRDAFIEIDAAAFKGPGFSASAPMYVSAQLPPDNSFVDLNFYFLFAYNGAQACHVQPVGSNFYCQASSYAEHQGDLEGVVIRVKPDFSEIILARFDAHGHESYYLAPSLMIQSGQGEQHVMVYCGLNSHATYNPAKPYEDGAVVLDKYSAGGVGVDFVDIVKPVRKVPWTPYVPNSKDTTNLYFVGLDTNREPVSEQVWARYSGRLGMTRKNKFEAALGVGKDLSASQRFVVEAAAAACEKLGIIPDTYFTGKGPSGLGARPGIPTLPTYGPDHVIWGGRDPFHGGDNGGVAVDAAGHCIVVHKGGKQGIYYTVGKVDGDRLGAAFGDPHEFGAGGLNIVVTMDNSGNCIILYRSAADDPRLYTRVGRADFSAQTVAWGAAQLFHGGDTGSIALHRDGYCVALHQGDGTSLYASVGIADLSRKTISWGDPRRFGEGQLPSIAVNDAGNVVFAYTTGEHLWTGNGTVLLDSRDFLTYGFGQARTVSRGTITMNGAGRCVLSYRQGDSALYYALGTCGFDGRSIAWDDPIEYDSGHWNSVVRSDADVLVSLRGRDETIYQQVGRCFPVID